MHEGQTIIKVLLALLLVLASLAAGNRQNPVTAVMAQTAVEDLVLVPGETRMVALDGTQAVELRYASPGSERLTLTVRAVEPTEPVLDPVVELLLPDNRRLAYNDDYRGNTTGLPALVATDAALTGIDLVAAGEYTVRINSFNGVSAGLVEVLLQVITSSPVLTLVPGQDVLMLEVVLQPGETYRLGLEVEAGVQFTVTARDPRGTRDPRLTLTDPAGNPVAINDDHGTADFTLNLFDARLNNDTVTDSGSYTLELREFAGQGGIFILKIQVGA